MTWGLPGAAMVCKTIRKGFDSLPRLQIFQQHRHKLWPRDYRKQELARLVEYHCTQAIDAKTEAVNLRDRLIAAQKELSALKRLKAEI